MDLGEDEPGVVLMESLETKGGAGSRSAPCRRHGLTPEMMELLDPVRRSDTGGGGRRVWVKMVGPTTISSSSAVF